MSKDNLDAIRFQSLDTLNRLLSLLFVGMNATCMTLLIEPLPNGFLACHDPSIVACVSGQVDVFVWSGTGKKIDVSREMARCVDEQDTSVLEDVDRSREVAVWGPWLIEIGNRLMR